ncbi:MAG: hypothetical protein OIF32_02810 [Campylobacterales bacterium]|nr:hypothetical protein [Campylobacterales bacterium]
MVHSSVYIILRPKIPTPNNVRKVVMDHNALFDNSNKGTMFHFGDAMWSTAYDDVSTVEDFLARLSKSDFLFIRVSSYTDIQVAGDYYDHNYRDLLPQNLVEFLEE